MYLDRGRSHCFQWRKPGPKGGYVFAEHSHVIGPAKKETPKRIADIGVLELLKEEDLPTTYLNRRLARRVIQSRGASVIIAINALRRQQGAPPEDTPPVRLKLSERGMAMVEDVAAGDYTFPEYEEPEAPAPVKAATGYPAPEEQQIAEYLGVAFVPNRLTKRIMGIRDSIQEQQERRAAFKRSFAEQIAKMGRRRDWLRGQPLAVQSWHEKYGNRDPDEVYGRKPVAPKPPPHDIMTGIVHDRDLSDLIQDQQEAKRVNGKAR